MPKLLEGGGCKGRACVSTKTHSPPIGTRLPPFLKRRFQIVGYFNFFGESNHFKFDQNLLRGL
jgi:hypothetical protein